jgi:hypothetical protein
MATEEKLQHARDLAEDLEACVLTLEQIRVGEWHFEHRCHDRRLDLEPAQAERAITDLARMIGFRSEELATQLRAALAELAPTAAETKKKRTRRARPGNGQAVELLDGGRP